MKRRNLNWLSSHRLHTNEGLPLANKCDLKVRVNFVCRWRLRRRGWGALKKELVVKEIGRGVWNSYSFSPIKSTLLQNDRNKLFQILASHPLCSSPPLPSEYSFAYYFPLLFSTTLIRLHLIGKVILMEGEVICFSIFVHLFPCHFPTFRKPVLSFHLYLLTLSPHRLHLPVICQ